MTIAYKISLHDNLCYSIIYMDRIFFLQLWGFLVLAWIARWALSLAPRVPTRSKDLEQISTLADLKEEQTFVEFWSWTSRVSTYVAQQNPQAHAIWVELALPLFVISRIWKKISGPPNLSLIWKDGFKVDLSNTDVIYTFWLPDTVNVRMKEKLLSEMKPGAKFISYVFKIQDREWWTTEHVTSRNNEGKIHVFTKS